MKRAERDRLKVVVYHAYMASQGDGKKTELILEALASKYHKTSRTIQSWIYNVQKRQYAQIDSLKGKDTQLEHRLNNVEDKAEDSHISAVKQELQLMREMGTPFIFSYCKDGKWYVATNEIYPKGQIE